jgi:hypothetical protein
MIKEAFIQPRFVGPRFEEHTLPLSAAKDLAAYEELVLELAKHLFREKQTDRVRLPKGFASDFSLHIAKIDEGSAKPALVAMMLGAQLFTTLPAEIVEAKDLINAVMATEEGQAFPVNFPKDFFSFFNRIGRSLKEGEKIEWTPDLANKTVLTPANRIRLARAHRETYEAEVDVVGIVKVLDTEKKTGILRTISKEPIAFVFGDPFFADLKVALGNSAIQVRLKGVGVFDVNNKLGSIIEIDQLDCLQHLVLVSKIDALSSLADGWLEGNGIAPSIANTTWLTDEVTKYFPEALEYPSVVPTEDGHVVFEWIRPQARIELEVNFGAQKLELYATNLTTNQFTEESFSTSDWDAAFSKIERLLLA